MLLREDADGTHAHTMREVLQSLANPRSLTRKRKTRQIARYLSRGSRLLHLWHLTSLDAPTVAVVWCCAVAWSVGVKVAVWAPLLLALVAWTLYIGDRLLDARAGMRTMVQRELRERHIFHWQHRSKLVICAAAAAAVSVWMIVVLLPKSARMPDSAVGLATLAYFSGVHSWRRKQGGGLSFLSRFVTKELLVGILFTAGCLLPVWARMRGMPLTGSARHLAAPAVFFAALAWLNCDAIAYWESQESSLGWTRVRRAACCIGIAGLLSAYFAAPTEPRMAALLAMGSTSAFLLACLDGLRSRFSSVTLRAAADFVLLTPVLLLVRHWLRS